MTEHAVVIVGGGPTGMMLGAELTLAGVPALIVERRATQEVRGTRAGGLSARTLEVLDQRGIVERFLAEGQKAQTVNFAGTLDISDFPTRHPYGLGLWQKHIERILAGWLAELQVPILRGRDVTGFTQDDAGVRVSLSGGAPLRAQYLVGCDGGRSLVRKAAGIDFPGWDATASWLIAEAEMSEQPKLGFHKDAAIGRVQYEIRDGKIQYADHGPVGIVLTEPTVGETREPTLDDIRAGLLRAYGTDFGVHSPTLVSRFTDATRQASAYRNGRVLLAGDAAHIHAPMGGQGLNLGVQDAVNLGWKLALVTKGIAPSTLLDTYHAERHPVGARVLKNSMALVALNRKDDRAAALRDTLADVVRMDGPRQHLAANLSGLGIRYDLGDGHPLLGRRMPDLDLGAVRVYTLLCKAQPVLLTFGSAVDPGAWSDRVQTVDVAYEGAWELPAIGSVPAPSAVLVRPDGYVAWVGHGTGAGLTDALTNWFGPGM